MHYVIEYEQTALLFMFFVIIHYYQLRSFPSTENRLFGLVLLVTAASLSTDIITAVTIERVFALPFWVNYLLNTIFYSIQIMLPLSMLFFVMALAGINTRKDAKRVYIITALLACYQIVSVLLNPFTKAIFYIDSENGFVHGRWFFTQYAVSAIYMLLILAVACTHREQLGKKTFRVVCASLAGIALAMNIQIRNPDQLVIGVAVTLGVINMVYILQNPRDITDIDSGVYNTIAMRMFLKECERRVRFVSLVALEIDNFPQIDRLLTPETSRKALNDVGTALAGISKKVFVFRVDEARFAVYTFEDREYDKIREKIEVRFRSGWEVPEKHLELKLTVCCIPHLPCKNAAERFPSIISAAFRQAESSGIRGNMFTADDAFLSGLYRNVAVDFALNNALRDGEGIEFGLQPIYSVKERRFTGAEALLRFHHADLGIVSPTELITIAERNGMILELDRTMVGLTADFIRANDPANNLGIKRIGINLSAVDFISAEIPQRLSDILHEKGIDPNAVIFEITETASATSPEVLRSCMKRFKEQGYRFALDDFGTGFANLVQLIDFPYDVVKLDQRMLTGSPIVFEHLVAMLSQMGVSLLVEGIETEEQAKMIETIPGISFAQGYYYARPMPPALFAEFIRIKNNLP